MNKFLSLSKSEQNTIYEQIGKKVGLPAQAIEKDLWVSNILQIIFSLPIAQHLIFKGGTSLSKAWNLIDRFSEDIDLAVSPTLLECKSGDLTKKQLKQLRKKSSLFVVDSLAPMLQEQISALGLDDYLSLDVQPNGEGDNTYPEPRQIYIHYKSAFDQPQNYLRPDVVLEIGARSLIEPMAPVSISSIIGQHLPINPLCKVQVYTAVPEKTFLEKVFLLHELFSVEGAGRIAARKSRHLYDLWRMMDKDFALQAIHDDELWESIRHHREIFTSVTGMDYTPDIRQRLVLVPREDILSAWRTDYATMISSMIYGDKPTFDELINQMHILEKRLKK